MTKILSTKHCSTAWVVNPSNQILLILNKKLNCWLPPGGGMEAKETPYQSAIRELEEETGIKEKLISPCHTSNIHMVESGHIGVICDFFLNRHHVIHNFLFKTSIIPNVIINEREIEDYHWHNIDEKFELKTTLNVNEYITFIRNALK